MKQKFDKKEILVPTVSLFIIALVATLLLSIVNGLTAGKIAAAQAQAETEARQSVFPESKSFKEEKDYFIAEDESGKTIGYVFSNSEKGYGGDVAVTVGIDKNGSITGIVPGDLSNETPGLGQTANNPDFIKQFKGKSGKIKLVKSAPHGNEIKALTSATVTSTAVTNAVNASISQFEAISGGVK